MVDAYKTTPAQEKPHRGEKRGHEAGEPKPAALKERRRCGGWRI